MGPDEQHARLEMLDRGQHGLDGGTLQDLCPHWDVRGPGRRGQGDSRCALASFSNSASGGRSASKPAKGSSTLSPAGSSTAVQMVKGSTGAEVAGMLNLSLAAQESRLHRARLELSAALRPPTGSP